MIERFQDPREAFGPLEIKRASVIPKCMDPAISGEHDPEFSALAICENNPAYEMLKIVCLEIFRVREPEDLGRPVIV